MTRTIGVILLALPLMAQTCPGDSSGEVRVVSCHRDAIRTPGTAASSELTVVEARGTVETATADSFHVALGFRVASTDLFGGVPVQNAQITIAIREGSAQIASTSLVTNAQGVAGTTATFDRPRVVLDVTAMLPNNGGEANKSPAAICLEVRDP